ncbi:MAG: aminotransferase class V-fold PLP-dependent enzyme [Proteobacteria bacterium]|nr:aminotransferase class V-fold PLP-dependent enzyme [Pseudomonadota bacterium]
MSALQVSGEEFRDLAARVVGLAGGLYAGLDGARAYPQASGTEVRQAFDEPLPREGLRGAAFDALEDVIRLSRLPTPRFFGYVFGSGEPVAALGDLMASVLNQNVTAWRSAPAAVSIERQVVRWIAEALGCPQLQGSLCGGGSSANLMGLAMAREALLPANESGARAGTLYCSGEVHMSIAKAVALLGLGRSSLRVVPADAQGRMSLRGLEAAIARDTAAGGSGIAVIASAGTVSTGAIDPLEEIASVCRAHKLWLHVDGAYGALGSLAQPHKFRGLERADSLSVDLHKWLYQPVDCGLLLFRDAAIARRTFAHTEDYARVIGPGPEEDFAFFEESLELSRRFRALKVWLSLRYHGLEAFRSAIGADLQHAQDLAAAIRGCPELELLAPVELSAVCFRHRGTATDRDLDRFNAALLRRLIANGEVYLSNATVAGRFALRACFVNHRTAGADVAKIVPEVLRAARSVSAGRTTNQAS